MTDVDDIEPLDPFERAVVFAIQRAERRDRQEAEARRELPSEPVEEEPG